MSENKLHMLVEDKKKFKQIKMICLFFLKMWIAAAVERRGKIEEPST